MRMTSAVAAACAVLTCGLAHAGIGSTPFSLSISQGLSYDSNIERTEGGRADSVSVTSVTAGFEKAYGRQKYSAAVTGMIQRFQDLTVYNNNGFSAEASIATEIGDRSKASLAYTANRSLQDFENRTGSAEGKRIVTNTNLNLVAEHGLQARWKLLGSLGFSEADYNLSTEENRTSVSGRVAVRHAPSDLLYFETGLRNTVSDYNNRVVFVGTPNQSRGEKINRWDLDFQTGLTATGLSQLTARVNLTNETQDTKDASKPDDSARDFTGVTGSLAWTYTPRGKLAYAVTLARDTNNSGGFSSNTFTSLRDRLNTSMDFTTLWRVTQKFSVRGNAGVTFIDEEERLQFEGGSLSEESSGTRGKLSVSLSYDYSRNLQLTCELTHAERTRTVFNSGFSSNLTNCVGTFLMD
jgi:hypothetical protein